MKRFLQKSLFRLHSLLLLVVMSVVGIGSAWAQSVTFDFKNEGPGDGSTGATLTKNGVKVTFASYGPGAEIYSTWNSYSILLESETNIIRVEFECNDASYGYGGPAIASAETFTFDKNGTSVWEGTATSLRFKGTDSQTDFYLPSMRIWLEGDEIGGGQGGGDQGGGGEVTYATVTSVSPAEGDILLDEDEYGLRNINIYFDGTWDNDVFAGEGHPIPDGVSFVGPNGPITISSSYGFCMWTGCNNISLATIPANLTTPGVYTLTIPAGLNTIGGNPNPAMEYTWTVVASTTFELTSTTTPSHETVKSLNQFTIGPTDGVTYESVTSPVNLNVGYDYDNPSVECTAEIVDGNVVVTLDQTYANKGSLRVELPQGFITASGLTSKAKSYSFSIDPNSYFQFASTSPAGDATVEGPVSTLTLVLPEGVEYGSCSDEINLNDVATEVTTSVDGNVVTIILPEPWAVGTTGNRYSIPEGFVTATDGSLSRSISAYGISVTRPAVDYHITLVDAPEGATVSIKGADGTFADGSTYRTSDVLTSADVSVDIAFYDGSVVVDETDITVTFSKVDYLKFDFRQGNNITKANVSCVATVSSDSSRGINIWNGNTLAISSSEFEIEKIEFPDFEPYNAGNDRSYYSKIKISEGGGSWKDGNDYNMPATWIAPSGSKSVTFTNNSGADFVIKYILVYLRQPINYTIDLVDAPDGASVKVNNDDTLDADGTYTTTSELNENSIVANCPETHYAEVEYTEANHTFTVTFKPWYIYNVSVNQMMGAVTYDGNSYYANGNQIKSKTAIDENEFEAYDLDGYDESVSVSGSDHTFTVTVTYTESAPTEYYIVFADGTPAGTSVSIGGNDYTSNGSYFTAVEVNDDDFNIHAPEGYYADETYNCYDADSRTFTVRVYEYYHYTVNVTGCDEGRAVVGGYSYAQDQKIESKTLLTESEVSTLPVARYDADFTINGDGHNYTIDVDYTAYPTLAIHSTSTDKEGNYWTSFCYNRPISLPAGFTPCIVTGAENGVLTVHEFEGENTEANVMYDFRPRGSVDKIGGNLYIEGNNHDLSVSVSGCSIYESYSNDGRLENEGTLTFSHPENISKIIVTPYGGGYGANISLDGASPVNVGNDAYTFDVNASSCVMNLTSNGNGVYIFAIEVVVGTDNTPVIPANTAILIKSDTENANINYTVHEEGDVNTDVSANILSASGETGFSVTDDADNLYYKLTLNAESEAGSAGFYWGVEGAHSISVPAHKAYLKLATPAASNRAAFLFGGDDTLTAIEGVSAEADNAPVFNLQGQRVNATKAGVYVKNGRKFIVK